MVSLAQSQSRGSVRLNVICYYDDYYYHCSLYHHNRASSEYFSVGVSWEGSPMKGGKNKHSG